MTDAVIDVEGLTKRFGDRMAVDGFSLRAPKGEIFGFLGPNGSGKTTTIRMICGLLRPDAGSGVCLGFDIRRESEKIKERVGYMTQHFSLYAELTVRENLDFMARLHKVKRPRDAVIGAMRDFELTERANQFASQLSGGWQQRLALAAATLHKPDLLLLDEPTAWRRIRRLAEGGVTALVSTHYMDEAVQCDRLAFIAYGKKLLEAPAGEVAARVGIVTWRVEGPDLKTLYHRLDGRPGIDQIARFGAALHVSGRDEAALADATADARADPAYRWSEAKTGIEEAFIYLMTGGRVQDR